MIDRTIFKFRLHIKDVQVVKMQRGAIILSIQPQFGQLCLWAELDRDAPIEDRFIEVFGTGNPIPDGKRTYVTTVQDGEFVWHIYELHRLSDQP